MLRGFHHVQRKGLLALLHLVPSLTCHSTFWTWLHPLYLLSCISICPSLLGFFFLPTHMPEESSFHPATLLPGLCLKPVHGAECPAASALLPCRPHSFVVLPAAPLSGSRDCVGIFCLFLQHLLCNLNIAFSLISFQVHRWSVSSHV